MYRLVCNNQYNKRLSYRKLLLYLHNTEFVYNIGMDSNRAEDGIDLRYRFGYENSIDDELIELYLDTKPCSVLEMIMALAIRCEESIMDNPAIGNRTGQWFWNMIVNLGLGSMHDGNFDEFKADYILHRFMNHEYDRDGKGGLFTIPNCKHDLRTTDIWYQAMWYLDNYI